MFSLLWDTLSIISILLLEGPIGGMRDSYNPRTIFLKTCFYTFCDTKNQKNSTGPISWRILCFFLQDQILFWKQCLIPCFWDIRYPPGGSLGLDRRIYKILELFICFCPIFNLVMANDRYEDSPEAFFTFFLSSTHGVLGPILSKQLLNEFSTTWLIFHRIRQDPNLLLRG